MTIIFLDVFSIEDKAIPALNSGKTRMGSPEPTNVVWQVGWNGDTGLGVKHRLSCRSACEGRVGVASEGGWVWHVREGGCGMR